MRDPKCKTFDLFIRYFLLMIMIGMTKDNVDAILIFSHFHYRCQALDPRAREIAHVKA